MPSTPVYGPHRLAIILALGSSTAFAFSPAQAQDKIAEFYKDKTITIYVGSSAGGGYDTYARLLSKHMGKYIPGNPKLLVQNMPGAGSNRAAGYVANAALKDGTAIAAVFSAQPLARIFLDKSKVGYDPSKLNYLGSASRDTYNCVVRLDAPVKTYKELFQKQLLIGATNPNASTGYMPSLQNNLLGTKIKLIIGYRGSRQIFAAIEKGELHGMCGMNWTSTQSTYKRFLDGKIAHILVQESGEGNPEANKAGIPRTVDFAKSEEAKKIMNTVYAQGSFARPYFVAGGVPKERVAALRKAFMASWADKGLLVDAKKLKFAVNALSGVELQRIVAEINAQPDAFIDKVKAAIKVNQPDKKK